MAKRRSDVELVGFAGCMMMHTLALTLRPSGDALLSKLGLMAGYEPERFDRIAETVLAEIEADDERRRMEAETATAARPLGDLLPFARSVQSDGAAS